MDTELSSNSCHLTRNYSIASLIGIVLVAVTLVYFYQQMALKALIEREGKANSDLAITLANTFWHKYADYVWMAGSTPAGELAGLEVVGEMRRDILHKVRGLRVAKVKIYNTDGLVVFSTEAGQIGENKARNTGFQSALQGHAVSETLFRNTFSSFEGNLYNRNLVASYVPVRRAAVQPVEGVLEIYSDITPLLADIDDTSSRILLVITVLMVLLYLFLLVFVRRAHLQLQEHESLQRWEQQQMIDYLEYHDEVTGLLNRKGVVRQMCQCQDEKRLQSVGVGVIAIKLRNLSLISGGFDHQRILQLLRQVADRVRDGFSSPQNIGHLSSGEFVLIIDNLISEAELDFLVDKLDHFLAEPFVIDDKRITLAIAIGADCSWDAQGHEVVVNNALLALEECEQQGRTHLRYDAVMEARKRENLDLEMEVGAALQERQFVLYYQPKIDLQSGEVSGMEALLRWRHPARGLVAPGTFIGLLEERSHIVELGQWLLEQACLQCRRWHDDGHTGLRMAVNVSIKQLQSGNFVQVVGEALQLSGLTPHALELELTESILADDTEEILRLMQQLKALGVQLSIDDFGTGYSSLSYLMHFPFDHIKIDRSFIRDMMYHRDHATLTNAIVTMAKSLRLGVVAEGVETQEQLRRVREMGCDEVQGFYFSQAVEAERFPYVISGINASLAECTAT